MKATLQQINHKIILSFLVVTMMFSLVGCAKADSAISDSTSSVEKETRTQPEVSLTKATEPQTTTSLTTGSAANEMVLNEPPKGSGTTILVYIIGADLESNGGNATKI